MKKMLMVSTVPSMIGQFNMDNIQILQEMGYEVHVACDFSDNSFWNEDKIQRFKEKLERLGVSYFQIDFTRKPLAINRHISAYKQLKKLISTEKYKFVHCHTPIAGAISRFVCKNQGVKCIYTAHGFHFYKGAPVSKWMIFFPIEWICSWFTDILITINNEDYEFAQKRMHSKEVIYTHGVGIEIGKFEELTCRVSAKREDIGISKTDILLLSVGELSKRKNQKVVIEAIAKINDSRIKYILCGTGDLEQYYRELSKELGIEKQVILLGYRNDIAEICKSADIFVFPSLQEGLPVSLMEAIASRTATVCSNIRGNVDLIHEKKCLFKADSVQEIIQCIKFAMNNDMSEYIETNYKHLREFGLDEVSKEMKKIYLEM